MNCPHQDNRDLLAPYRAALYDLDLGAVSKILGTLTNSDTPFRLSFPFETLDGPEAYIQNALTPLATALPDLERRDYIVISGLADDGTSWVGSAGYYTGTFLHPFLDIPATGHQAHMRFHEFFRFEGDRIIEMQTLWDIPELMMQANAWPMAPSLGREWLTPAPATQDGIKTTAWNKTDADASCGIILDMLAHLTRHPKQGGPEVMEMDRFWHPKFSWYGPAGIGTGRGVSGFRDMHQIPFLNAMPDRGLHTDEAHYHFFAQDNYAAVTGWPVMVQTHTHDGWLGLPPTGKKIHLRSLDFWRLENGLIRENWVLVDLLSLYDQLGIDVFQRMREFNKFRAPYTGRT